MTLDGRIALVTGASRGIGRGVALEMGRAGATVIINHRDSAQQAEEVQAEIEAAGGTATVIQADVSKSEQVARLFAEITEQFGGIDVLVNNAGTAQPKDILEMTEEDWDFIINTNLKSVFLCCKTAFPLMVERGGGRIINMSSIVSRRGALYGHVHYAATKGGINAFTMTLARTGAPHDIRVNAVAPGIIDTELLRQTHDAETIAGLEEGVPLGLGTVEDVGRACVYLASDECRYMTGHILDLNGGMHMG